MGFSDWYTLENFCLSSLCFYYGCCLGLYLGGIKVVSVLARHVKTDLSYICCGGFDCQDFRTFNRFYINFVM